jgi:hypothetical protein
MDPGLSTPYRFPSAGVGMLNPPALYAATLISLSGSAVEMHFNVVAEPML